MYTITGSVGAVMNMAGRLVCGGLYDEIGFKKTYIIILLIQVIISATFIFAVKNEVMLPIWVSLSYFCLGGHLTIFPTLADKIYGI